MEEIISKELLSDVLYVRINDIVNSITTPSNLFGYEIKTGCSNHLGDDTEYRQINIHELAHKCKDWAYSEGYEILSSTTRTNVYKIGSKIVLHKEVNLNKIYDVLNDIKACQWIYENKKEM